MLRFSARRALLSSCRRIVWGHLPCLIVFLHVLLVIHIQSAVALLSCAHHHHHACGMPRASALAITLAVLPLAVSQRQPLFCVPRVAQRVARPSKNVVAHVKAMPLGGATHGSQWSGSSKEDRESDTMM